MKTAPVLLVLLAVACGDDGGSTVRRDAAVNDGRPGDAVVDTRLVDAAPDAQAFVVTVTPCTGEVGTITTSGAAYSPSTLTITQNEIVKFVMISGSNHNVDPHSTLPTDPGLSVGFAETKCLRFTTTGTFNFMCEFHGTGLQGAITVN